MKFIKKKSKQKSLPLIVFVILFFFIGLFSFILSIRFSGENKLEVRDLILDTKIQSPDCIINSGFYTEPFEIKLTTKEKCKIYYSLDGTSPSLKSNVYNKPILIQNRTSERENLSIIPTSPRWKPPVGNIFKGTVLKAIAVNEEFEKSEELIRNFFVDEKGINRYTFPIVCLTINQEDLFGYKNGIYVLGKNYNDKNDYIKKNIALNLPWWKYPSNYLKRGDNSERPVFIEYFETNGKIAFSEKAGIRINGNATRGYAQKSLRICFDKKYGKEKLNYKLFRDYDVSFFNSFILRNSGNDWDKTMFRDMFMQSLLQNENIETQKYLPVIVFINGEYWGIHDLCERYDENFISNKYKISLDSISLIESVGKDNYGSKKELKSFEELLSYIKTHDIAIDTNYEFVEKKIDIENFINIIIANVYFCNNDWPSNNVKFWRYKTNQQDKNKLSKRDGRWRWMLYDTDWGFGYSSSNSYEINLLDKASQIGSIGIIFDKLLRNKIFKKLLIEQFHKNLNTIFQTDYVLMQIDNFEKIYSPEMIEHINRWRSIGSYSEWKKNIEVLKLFARKRPHYQIEQLNQFLNLK